MNLLFYNFTNL